MKRADAEQAARSYCNRNVVGVMNWRDISRPAAERVVIGEARQLYGHALTNAAVRRIRKQLRERRP